VNSASPSGRARRAARIIVSEQSITSLHDAQQCVGAVFCRKFGQALRCAVIRRHLCAEVAQPLARRADIGENDRVDRGVGLPSRYRWIGGRRRPSL
jgi:hypothetical protein